MAKTYIGVDVDRSRLHVVCLEQGADGLFIRAIANREIAGIDQAAEAVAEIVAGWGVVTTRMAAALPFDNLLSRTVTFPFSDQRKVAAAAPLELAAKLPLDLDDYLTTVLPTGRDGDLFRSIALAVPETEVAQFLEAFDRQQLPLRVLDVAPFADLQVLSQETPDAILVTIRAGGYVVARSAAGVMQSYRQSIITETMTDAALADAVLRDTQVLLTQLPERPPIFLVGAGLTAQRQRELIDRLPGATVPEAKFESGRLSAEYLPALALAHRATAPNSKACCNLRQGRYAYRGSLAPFRRQLIAIAVLLTLALVTAASGFWFGYARKAGDLASLDRTLQTIYRQSFPGAPVPADVPLFMASNLAGLHAESRSLGATQIDPLQVLDALTAGIGSDVGIDVQRFDFDVEGVALYGRADSFDGVDQLAARIRQQAVFTQVQIGDAKMSVDGSRVDFRVDIDFSAAGGDR